MTPQPMPLDWLRPDWPAPPQVRALFTSRAGGVSQAPFDSFNLGDHVRDDPVAVSSNRARLAVLCGAQALYLHQVHGVAVHRATAQSPQGITADAAWTDEPGVVCTAMVADCLPILLCDRAGTWVAAAHAGWRGLAGVDARGHVGAGGIVESTISAVAQCPRAKSATKKIAFFAADEVLAWLGPCIGTAAFEVGAEVRDAFLQHDARASAAFRPASDGKFWADLPLLARQRLAALGVTAVFGNDGSPDWCTHTQAQRWFSHRRDAATLGSTGRMVAAIALAR